MSSFLQPCSYTFGALVPPTSSTTSSTSTPLPPTPAPDSSSAASPFLDELSKEWVKLRVHGFAAAHSKAERKRATANRLVAAGDQIPSGLDFKVATWTNGPSSIPPAALLALQQHEASQIRDLKLTLAAGRLRLICEDAEAAIAESNAYASLSGTQQAYLLAFPHTKASRITLLHSDLETLFAHELSRMSTGRTPLASTTISGTRMDTSSDADADLQQQITELRSQLAKLRNLPAKNDRRPARNPRGRRGSPTPRKNQAQTAPSNLSSTPTGGGGARDCAKRTSDPQPTPAEPPAPPSGARKKTAPRHGARHN
jgi:hypothetical protein